MKQLPLIEIPPLADAKQCLRGCSMCCYDPHGHGRWVQLQPCDDQVPDDLVAVDEDGNAWMKHRPDRSCVALANGRCSIYADRPLTCRQYEAQTDCAQLITRHREGVELPGAP